MDDKTRLKLFLPVASGGRSYDGCEIFVLNGICLHSRVLDEELMQNPVPVQTYFLLILSEVWMCDE